MSSFGGEAWSGCERREIIESLIRNQVRSMALTNDAVVDRTAAAAAAAANDASAFGRLSPSLRPPIIYYFFRRRAEVLSSVGQRHAGRFHSSYGPLSAS